MRDNIRGILAMSASMLALTLNFAFVKLGGAALPIGEVLFIRGSIAAIIIGAVAVATGMHRRFRMVLHRSVAWRTLGECTGAVFFITALFQIPLANATVILQALPLALTAGAALFLGEIVRWRRWLAIAIGFAGVLVIIRPGLATFSWASLLVLAAVLFSSIRDLTTRLMPDGIPSILVATVASAALAAVGLTFAVFEDWAMPTRTAFLQLAASGVFLSVGLFFVVLAMRRGELSVIAPFRYLSVVWAIILGYLFWSDVPDLLTILGTIIIVCSGIYISYRGKAVRVPDVIAP